MDPVFRHFLRRYRKNAYRERGTRVSGTYLEIRV